MILKINHLLSPNIFWDNGKCWTLDKIEFHVLGRTLASHYMFHLNEQLLCGMFGPFKCTLFILVWKHIYLVYLILNSLLTMLASIWFMTLVSLNWEHPTTCAKTQEVPSVQHPAYPYCSFVWGQKFDMQNLQGALKLHCNNPATLVGLLIFVRSLTYSFGNSQLNLRSMCLSFCVSSLLSPNLLRLILSKVWLSLPASPPKNISNS